MTLFLHRWFSLCLNTFHQLSKLSLHNLDVLGKLLESVDFLNLDAFFLWTIPVIIKFLVIFLVFDAIEGLDLLSICLYLFFEMLIFLQQNRIWFEICWDFAFVFVFGFIVKSYINQILMKVFKMFWHKRFFCLGLFICLNVMIQFC